MCHQICYQEEVCFTSWLEMLAWLKKSLVGFAWMGTWVAERHITGMPWLCSEQLGRSG